MKKERLTKLADHISYIDDINELKKIVDQGKSFLVLAQRSIKEFKFYGYTDYMTGKKELIIML